MTVNNIFHRNVCKEISFSSVSCSKFFVCVIRKLAVSKDVMSADIEKNRMNIIHKPMYKAIPVYVLRILKYGTVSVVQVKISGRNVRMRWTRQFILLLSNSLFNVKAISVSHKTFKISSICSMQCLPQHLNVVFIHECRFSFARGQHDAHVILRKDKFAPEL